MDRVPDALHRDAGRVRGYFRGQAKLLCPAKSSQCCYTLPVRIPTRRVRELRRNQTEAEKAAWYLLRVEVGCCQIDP